MKLAKKNEENKQPRNNVRGRETYERILLAAQDLLHEGGIDAFTTNAIANRAGVSPPSFYNLFKDKYALLEVLCDRLQAEQEEVIRAATDRFVAGERAEVVYKWCLEGVLDATIKYRGGYKLLVTMRALASLSNLRLSSNHRSAQLVTEALMSIDEQLDRRDVYLSARIAVELAHTYIEMMFETNFKDRKRAVEKVCKCIENLLDYT